MTLHNKLVLEHIQKSFVDKRQTELVLQDISLHVAQGEFVSLIGPSGSGKSTILQIIGGLVEPSAGSVRLDDQDVTGKRGLISYMPQADCLFPWRTIEENVITALEVAGVNRDQALKQAREWLPRIGLGGYEKKLPQVLSGGMRQRVSFLRALLSEQELMCLDEPFGALDALTRLDMQKWLLSIWEQDQRSVLFVTHSIEEALYLSDRIYVLSEKPTLILQEFQVPWARPRDSAVTLSPAFQEMKQAIYSSMQRGQVVS
ncbi:ABC transporter ATP-binding protein [Paenibacillus sp. N1-5-1-14]|uniref:ABC transporter ATP-binding protein n=1 Tax=Paenibacillus radicibacter TaxID=2972488 RepID=UPI002158EDE7|nr:ABC transporter ATP-binding protein [Paenibacillus radicibacter]MCR8642072.1 ABC transporter ATP-binding protein [Paenibacillus radicibacter]